MRVLFTSTSGWGHIHPMVPLAKAFQARGDEVLWATAPDVRHRLEQEGIPTAPAGLEDGVAMATFYERYPEVAEVPPPQRSDFMFPRLFGAVRGEAMLTALIPVARDASPDLLVCDQAEFAGPIVAAMSEVPNVTMSFGSTLPAPRVESTGALVAGLWAAQGLEARPFGGTYDHCYLDIYPPSLQSADRPHIPNVQLLRPGDFATGGVEPLPDWVTDGGEDPLVYVTLGTVFSNAEVLGTVVGALRELPVRAVVTVGPRGEPDALGPQPDNVHVARYIPQAQLLGHCSAVVSHGGSGTFLAALAAELPQVCLPQAADQFANAAAGAQAGAGIAILPDALSGEAVAEAVTLVLEKDAYRAAARRLSGEIAAMPAPAEVADSLSGAYG